MIDEADEQMLEWARRVVPDVPVSIAPPPSADAGPGVRIHLLSLAPVAAPRGAKRPPLALALRYLVTTSADSESEAHRWLGVLAFDALDRSDWSVEAEPPGVVVWQAFDVAPRPAFIVRVPLRLERKDREAPLVRTPLVVDMHSTTSLAGLVTGPEDIPIAGATLEIPSLQLFAETDGDGVFRFPQIPASSSITLVVRAKRQTRTIRARTGEPLHVRIDGLEG